MQMKMQLKNDRGGEKVTWSCGDCWRQRRQQGWWRLLAAAEWLPLFFFFPCVFFALFFLFLLSSFVSLLGATGGCGEEEQRWRCWAEGGRRWFFFFPPSTPPLVFFLSVLLCFSSPSLVLLALAALMVTGWRCCCGGGKETRRWCPGGEERSFFFSVLRPPVFVLLFPTYAFAFSPLFQTNSSSSFTFCCFSSSLPNTSPQFFLFSTTQNTHTAFVFSTVSFLSPLFSVLPLVSTFGPFLFHGVSLFRSHLSFSPTAVGLSLGLPHFLFFFFSR
jgi:hypothetical protein